MDTAIAVVSITALVGVLFLIMKFRRTRKDINHLKRLEAQQPFRQSMDTHSSISEWQRAAENSHRASRERREVG